MKKKLRGIRLQATFDLDQYRVRVPIKGQVSSHLSVIDFDPPEAHQTIIFLHGYAGCAETWQYQIDHFAQTRQYRIVVPDLRGHGQSDAPFTRYTMDELVGDLRSVVEGLGLREPFVLAGHSFGGSICIEYASAYPHTLAKLILVSTGGAYPLRRFLYWIARLPAWFFRLWWEYRPAWNAEVHTMKRILLNNFRFWEGWSKLSLIFIPALLIIGENDDYFPRHIYERVGDLLPNATVQIIPGAKHKVQLKQPVLVNCLIEQFVADQRISRHDNPAS